MKRIYRSRGDRVLGGVCGGIAEYFDLDPALVRVVWIFLSLFGGSGILAYIIALIIIPDASDALRVDPESVHDSSSKKTVWAVLLIIVGAVLLFQHGDLMGIVWHKFWGSGLNVMFSLALIGLGIYMLIARRSEITKTITDGMAASPLHLSILDKKLAGVCAGIGESMDIDPVIVRFLWVFGTIMSVGVGVLLYIVLALVLPKGVPTTDES